MTNDVEYSVEDVPVACSLTANALVTRGAEIDDLFSGIEQVRELADGYALQFPGTSEWPQRVLNFISGERSCCLFFTFELVFLANMGPIWLHIRGPEGTKEMVKDSLAGRQGLL